MGNKKQEDPSNSLKEVFRLVRDQLDAINKNLLPPDSGRVAPGKFLQCLPDITDNDRMKVSMAAGKKLTHIFEIIRTVKAESGEVLYTLREADSHKTIFKDVTRGAFEEHFRQAMENYLMSPQWQEQKPAQETAKGGAMFTAQDHRFLRALKIAPDGPVASGPVVPLPKKPTRVIPEKKILTDKEFMEKLKIKMPEGEDPHAPQPETDEQFLRAMKIVTDEGPGGGPS